MTDATESSQYSSSSSVVVCPDEDARKDISKPDELNFLPMDIDEGTSTDIINDQVVHFSFDVVGRSKLLVERSTNMG